MIDLLKTIGEKGKPFSELSRLYTVHAKTNDPYIDSFIDSFLSFPDPPNVVLSDIQGDIQLDIQLDISLNFPISK